MTNLEKDLRSQINSRDIPEATRYSPNKLWIKRKNPSVSIPREKRFKDIPKFSEYTQNLYFRKIYTSK